MTSLLSDSELKSLRDASISAKSLAYAPYSNFRVGSAILTTSGKCVLGANIENASYPVGTCAERVAFGRGVVEGDIKAGGGQVKAVGVAVDTKEPASPCGMCRQFIREFASLQTPIYMFNGTGDHVVKTLEELLPMSFGPDSLPPSDAMKKIQEGN